MPAFSVQYHPEAGPGPHDARYLFAMFDAMMHDPGGFVQVADRRRRGSNTGGINRPR